MTKDIGDRSPRSLGEANASARPVPPALAAATEAVIDAACAYQCVLKSLKPWEMSPVARGIIADYDDELPSIIERTSRALYDAIEELKFQRAHVTTEPTASADARAALSDGEANSVPRNEDQS